MLDSKDLESYLHNMDKIFEIIDASDNPYQCKVWFRLIMDSIKDIDNRTIRKEILAHPSGCDHPTCIQMSKTLRGIMN